MIVKINTISAYKSVRILNGKMKFYVLWLFTSEHTEYIEILHLFSQNVPNWHELKMMQL